MDRQGADRENVPRVLCHDRPRGVGEDRVCLLGHVETLSGGDPRQVLPGTQHPRPVSHCRQGEQGAGRHPRLRSPTHEEGRIRAGPDEVSLVPSQAAREPHRPTETEAERSGALQPPERSWLSAQGRLPVSLELRVHHVGRQVPRPVVSSSDALADRTTKEGRQNVTHPPRTHSQLFSCPQRVFQRRNRGPQQQSKSHYEKILRVPNVPGYRTRPISFTWQASRAGTHPQILLTNQIIFLAYCGSSLCFTSPAESRPAGQRQLIGIS